MHRANHSAQGDMPAFKRGGEMKSLFLHGWSLFPGERCTGPTSRNPGYPDLAVPVAGIECHWTVDGSAESHFTHLPGYF